MPHPAITRILQAAVDALDPATAVRRALSAKPPAARRVWIVGAGKAGAPMARAAAECLGEHAAGGVVAVPGESGSPPFVPSPPGDGRPHAPVTLVAASHPVPSAAGVAAARRILATVAAAESGDLVLCLLSGGGSALMPLPAAGLTLDDKAATTRLLLASGASIQEMNCVRKHLSALKGGQLAAALAKGVPMLALVLSDVVGDDLATIASGPAAPDPSTYGDALAIAGRYGLTGRLPPAALARLEAGAAGRLPETPKPGDPIFQHVEHRILSGHATALDAAGREARRLGFEVTSLGAALTGEASELARRFAGLARAERGSREPDGRAPLLLLGAGETVVTVRGDGLGGRNTEFALAAAIAIDGLAGIQAGAFATDGADGTTGAAGAIADGETCRRAAALGLDAADHLARNDSWTLFRHAGGLLETGPTGANAGDLYFAVVL